MKKTIIKVIEKPKKPPFGDYENAERKQSAFSDGTGGETES